VQQNRGGVQKQFKLFGLFKLLFLLLSIASLNASSFEDFKRTQSSQFSDYKDKRDAEFENYLTSSWEEYTAKATKDFYEKPKPKSIAPTVERKIRDLGPRVNIKLPKITPQKKPIVVKTLVKKDFMFNFFGQELAFDIDENIKEVKFYPQNQVGIASAFKVFASSDYEDTVRELNTICKTLHLNDWALYLLVKQLANEMYSNSDESALFTWFMLNKLGYDVKVGLSKHHIVLLHYSKKVIYATPSYSFSEKHYYRISQYSKTSKDRVYTYPQSYPGVDKALDLALKELPLFVEDLRKRELHFKQFNKEYTVSYKYNQNLINFMQTYPQADYETFFNAPLTDSIYQEIAKDLKKYINTMQSSSAINFVLNFVQKAFIYERDGEQFGREKVMFAYETLYYDKSDCEDRAILFASLVKKLFGISVVGVKYKDHMATALYIPMKGDSVMNNGKRFVIADPTYINANIGQSMPKYRSKIPESFIVVKSRG